MPTARKNTDKLLVKLRGQRLLVGTELVGEKEKGFGVENQGEEKHLSGAEYPSAPLVDEIKEVPGSNKSYSTSHSGTAEPGENSELPTPCPKLSPLPHSPSCQLEYGAGQGKQQKGGGGGVAGHYPRSGQSRVSAAEGGRAGAGEGVGRPRGGERGAGGTPGLARAPGRPPEPRAQARLPWGGGGRRCGRCWRCCCCCRGRFPGRTARSPAAARPTAPCAAPARAPASPDCEYAAPRPGTLARSRATLSPYSLAPLPGSLEQKSWPYQIPPPFKVMRRQNLGTVFVSRAAPWVAQLPGALCSPWGSQARDFPVGAVATGVELPRSYGGSPAPCLCWKGTGCDAFLSAAASVFDLCTSQLGEGYCDLWHPELL